MKINKIEDITMKKYCLFSGYVYSADGDRHYVGALELPRLYKVAVSECILAPKNERGWRIPDGLIELHPDSSGRYCVGKAT